LSAAHRGFGHSLCARSTVPAGFRIAGLVLLAAAVPLLLAPPALAGEKKPERKSVCRTPDIDLSYDTKDVHHSGVAAGRPVD